MIKNVLFSFFEVIEFNLQKKLTKTNSINMVFHFPIMFDNKSIEFAKKLITQKEALLVLKKERRKGARDQMVVQRNFI